MIKSITSIRALIVLILPFYYSQINIITGSSKGSAFCLRPPSAWPGLIASFQIPPEEIIFRAESFKPP